MADRFDTAHYFYYVHNSFQHYRHTDNSGGIQNHFLARMRRGTARIVPLRGKELTLAVGDIFYLPRGLCYHSYWYGDEMGDDRAEWDTFAFTYLPEFSGKRFAPQIIQPEETVEQLWGHLMQCRDDTMSASGLLYQLFGYAYDRLEQTDTDPQRALLERVKAYMAANPQDGVEEVARRCHLSTSAIYRLFREHADMTTTEWKNRCRVQRAYSMLTSTDLSVEEISQRLGFCSATYFRKVVKQITGHSPSDIRRFGAESGKP